MDKKIEAAIRETLVIGNPVSIKRCVDKLKLIFEQEQALRQASVSGSLPIANPHHCPECSWQCTCSSQPCSCCQGNDR